ncbi:G-protein coupled receptor family C group 6 member A-like [Engraulis encrasicolus]|uniref:G-protein coupled receptor family C group 6 member A-like n=1 Tax=Engraulis encrasicolus TaxID=184585 RepID=UPI002FD255DC
MASKDGDIIIGGIFPVHESVNFTDTIDGRPSRRVCTRYNVARLLQTLMLIEAVETINNSSLLGNLTLGYRIVDSCADVTRVLYMTQRFLDVNRTMFHDICKTENRTHRNDWQNASLKPVDVVIGGSHSEISIAVARQLSIHVIPQISYASTTGFLSDKSRFPAFMRTVPEDKYQAHAIADILERYGWNWVGVVTTDGDYGRYIANRFRERAKEKNICIAFSTVLPDILDACDLKDRVMETIKKIEDDSRIGVIVSFAKADHMKDIMRLISPNAKGRTWLASDNWATSAPRVLESSNLTLKDIGSVIGVTLKSATSESFNSYLDNLNPNLAANENNTILRWYIRWLKSKGKRVTQPDLGKRLKNNVYPYAIFSVGMAVKAIANMTECLVCPDKHWSREGSHECQKEEELVFDWEKPFAIILVTFSSLGIILTLVVLILFLTWWKTPVVKASVGPVSVLLLMSLLVAFASTILFVGNPSRQQCQARQVLFGLSFTVSVSCVLVKSLKIVLAFQVGTSGKPALAKLLQPYLIIGACVSVQVAICATWLTKSPPQPKRGESINGQVVLLCEEGENGNFLYFGLMLGYIGVLSLAGFIIAFKGRKLPDCFNEAKYISFGLLIYLICWVLFGPIYAHAKAGEYQPAMEMIVILFSAYGLLGTLFLPKCYIILFKRDANTREAFLRCIRLHNCRGSQKPPDSMSTTTSNITSNVRSNVDAANSQSTSSTCSDDNGNTM